MGACEPLCYFLPDNPNDRLCRAFVFRCGLVCLLVDDRLVLRDRQMNFAIGARPIGI